MSSKFTGSQLLATQISPNRQNAQLVVRLMKDLKRAIANVYQRNQSDALTWSEMQPLYKIVKSLSDKFIPRENMQQFKDLVLRYIKIVMEFISNYQYLKSPKHDLAVLLSVVTETFSEEADANDFICETTLSIFELYLFNNYSLYAKKQLLQMFNQIALVADKEILRNLVEDKMDIMYKLFDCLSNLGDYTMQVDVMIAIFKLYGHKIKYKLLKYDPLPEYPELGEYLHKVVNSADLNSGVRKWLNQLNSKSNVIFSIAINKISVGNVNCNCPKEGEFSWFDFNMKDKEISFYSNDFISDQDFPNRITIPAKDTSKVEIQRNKEIIALFIQQKKPFHSSEFSLQVKWNEMGRNIKIDLDLNQDKKSKINTLIMHVLPQIFGNKFSHSSARIDSIISESVYKPLSIKTSKRSRSSERSPIVSSRTSLKSPQEKISMARVDTSNEKLLFDSFKSSGFVDDELQKKSSVGKIVQADVVSVSITDPDHSLLNFESTEMFTAQSDISEVLLFSSEEEGLSNKESNIPDEEPIPLSHSAQILSGSIQIFQNSNKVSNEVNFQASEILTSTPVKTSRNFNLNDEDLLSSQFETAPLMGNDTNVMLKTSQFKFDFDLLEKDDSDFEIEEISDKISCDKNRKTSFANFVRSVDEIDNENKLEPSEINKPSSDIFDLSTQPIREVGRANIALTSANNDDIFNLSTQQNSINEKVSQGNLTQLSLVVNVGINRQENSENTENNVPVPVEENINNFKEHSENNISVKEIMDLVEENINEDVIQENTENLRNSFEENKEKKNVNTNVTTLQITANDEDKKKTRKQGKKKTTKEATKRQNVIKTTIKPKETENVEEDLKKVSLAEKQFIKKNKEPVTKKLNYDVQTKAKPKKTETQNEIEIYKEKAGPFISKNAEEDLENVSLANRLKQLIEKNKEVLNEPIMKKSKYDVQTTVKPIETEKQKQKYKETASPITSKNLEEDVETVFLEDNQKQLIEENKQITNEPVTKRPKHEETETRKYKENDVPTTSKNVEENIETIPLKYSQNQLKVTEKQNQEQKYKENVLRTTSKNIEEDLETVSLKDNQKQFIEENKQVSNESVTKRLKYGAQITTKPKEIEKQKYKEKVIPATSQSVEEDIKTVPLSDKLKQLIDINKEVRNDQDIDVYKTDLQSRISQRKVASNEVVTKQLIIKLEKGIYEIQEDLPNEPDDEPGTGKKDSQQENNLQQDPFGTEPKDLNKTSASPRSSKQPTEPAHVDMFDLVVRNFPKDKTMPQTSSNKRRLLYDCENHPLSDSTMKGTEKAVTKQKTGHESRKMKTMAPSTSSKQASFLDLFDQVVRDYPKDNKKKLQRSSNKRRLLYDCENHPLSDSTMKRTSNYKRKQRKRKESRKEWDLHPAVLMKMRQKQLNNNDSISTSTNELLLSPVKTVSPVRREGSKINILQNLMIVPAMKSFSPENLVNPVIKKFKYSHEASVNLIQSDNEIEEEANENYVVATNYLKKAIKYHEKMGMCLKAAAEKFEAAKNRRAEN